MTQQHVHATLLRGGTSKGVYFRRDALPADESTWDDLLLRAFGSPDPMQLDGIGGSHSTTSKAMIVWASEESGADLDYRFGQVAVDQPVVDWGGNCGNLTFAIGVFGIEAGLVDVGAAAGVEADGAGRVDLTLFNDNTGTVVEQTVPVDADGMPQYEGDFVVYGVPGSGGRIRSRFLDPDGSETGALFPTGKRTETMEVEELGEIEVSIVDVSNPCVFAHASDLGLTGAEKPDEINENKEASAALERIRSIACERAGIVDDADEATAVSPGIPKVAFVGERRAYQTVGGDTVEADEYDILARIMSMQKAHHAYAVTGAMCTASSALFEGTVPHQYAAGSDEEGVTIGHPKGTMWVGVGRDAEAERVTYTEVDRTARKIMDGELFYIL